MIGPEEREPTEEELREEDVTASDRLDDRVDEAAGLGPDPGVHPGAGHPRGDTVHSEPDDILPPADAPINSD